MGEKNYDPVMHTAEHLVNGTIARMLGCGRAFSTHIEKKKSKCDFRFPRNLSPDEAGARYSLERLPEGAESVRIVHIGDYDACPCIGSHVANTAEIPPVSIISSDCTDGVLRVRFKFRKN